MDGTRIYDLEQTNREQRQEIDKLKETIKALKQQDKETRLSYYRILQELSRIGHSNNQYKIIKMTDKIDKAMDEMWEDLEINFFVENDEEGKIIELADDDQSKH